MPVAPDTGQDMPTGLFRRGAAYSLRRVVPKDLQPILGRNVIVRALGTPSLAEAKRRHPHVWLEIERDFDTARSAMNAPSGLVTEAAPPSPEVPLSEISPTRISVAEVDRLRRMREDAAGKGELLQFTKWANETLRLTQAMLSGEVEPSHPLPYLEGVRNGLRSVLTGEGAHYIAAARRTRDQIDSDRKSHSRESLPSLVGKWAGEAAPIERTRKRVLAIVAEFEGHAGARSADAYKRADILAFKDHLLSIQQTPSNINAKLSLLSIPFAYAAKNDVINDSPTRGISVIDTRKAKEKRRSFNDLEIERLFSGPVHQRGARPLAGAGEAAYWLPLLALYTGARLTELGQLQPDDVLEEEYVAADGQMCTAWVLRIVENHDRGQRLKTEGSERRIPIHADLIKLGLLPFCETARITKHHRLFRDIRAVPTGDLMAPWSKWFGRYRRLLGVTGKDTPFHSFRHTFKHNARLVGMKTEVHNALTGHETGDVADTYGGLSFPLAPLVEGVTLYRVPGFRLPPPPAPPR